ncbi:MAG: ion transporter [Candidatus Competibacteraceae bacterium]|nr:ion transporter [Candidatus Competibacteraceae bacterium]
MQNIFSLSKKIADNKSFQAFIIFVILVAGVVVGIQTYKEKVAHIEHVLNLIDFIIILIFTVEIAIKMLAEGSKPWKYFSDAWNIFDFSIVAVCYLAFIVPTIDASFIAVLRLARILRVFRLVTTLPKLQLLVGALLKSIPSMGYVAILLGLLFYIYGSMGVFMFSENDPVHFGNLQLSVLSLFRVVTLEDWTDIMYINIYGCDHSIWGYSASEGCTNPKGFGVGAALFFISFVLIGTMIVLNLFIGVIMSSMDEAKKDAEAKMQEDITNKNGLTLLDEMANLSSKMEEIKVRIDTIHTKLKKEG